MDGMTEYQQVLAFYDECAEHIENMRIAEQDAAQAENAYRMKLSTELLTWRAKGTPSTIVGDVVRGLPVVAQQKLTYQCAEANRRAELELSLLKKKQGDFIREQMARDYSSPTMKGYINEYQPSDH